MGSPRGKGQFRPFGYMLKPFEDSRPRTAIELALDKNRAERRLRGSERLGGRDVTDRRRVEEGLREGESRFRGIFDSAGVGIAQCDLRGRYIRVNQKYCDILGYTRDELATKTFKDLTHPDDIGDSVDHFGALMRGELPSYAMEKRCISRQGETLWVQVTASMQRDTAGRPVHSIAVMQDISERKRFEEELRSAKAVAEAANRAKDDFISNVSHEIRTPMHAILGMTELVLDTKLTDEQRQLLRTVESAAGSLLVVINDLLDFSKIEAGKVALEQTEFALRAAVADTLRALTTRAHCKGLEILCNVSPDVPDALIGDSGRLRQVLVNLVGNAIKFTEAGEVEVQVGLAQGSAEAREVAVGFSVRDTGIGIAREKQATIFRAFEQEDTSTTRKYGGTGLGLTIAASLVALMGGEIAVDSEPGKGSVFSFTGRFLRQPLPARSPAATTQPRGAGTALSVLVAEDDEFSAQLFYQLLARSGHHVRIVKDGREAVELLDRARFDLMLLDLHMPDMDGFQVIRVVRERERATGEHLPVIAVTARTRPEDRERVLAAGIDDFLAKPIQAGALSAAIERVTAAAAPAALRPHALLDARALLAACGGDEAILSEICAILNTRLPPDLAEIDGALRARDAARLRKHAHKISAMVGAFSSRAEKLALNLEDRAAHGDLEQAAPLVAELARIAEELLHVVPSISLASLQRDEAPGCAGRSTHPR